jgi:hypothetical protein
MKQKWHDLFTLMEEASKHPNRSTFANKKRKAYNAANELGMLDTFFPAKQWTMDEAIDEALKHTSRSEFRRASPGAFAAMERNGLLDFYFLRWKHPTKAINLDKLRAWTTALWNHHKTNWK